MLNSSHSVDQPFLTDVFYYPGHTQSPIRYLTTSTTHSLSTKSKSKPSTSTSTNDKLDSSTNLVFYSLAKREDGIWLVISVLQDGRSWKSTVKGKGKVKASGPFEGLRERLYPGCIIHLPNPDFTQSLILPDHLKYQSSTSFLASSILSRNKISISKLDQEELFRRVMESPRNDKVKDKVELKKSLKGKDKGKGRVEHDSMEVDSNNNQEDGVGGNHNRPKKRSKPNHSNGSTKTSTQHQSRPSEVRDDDEDDEDEDLPIDINLGVSMNDKFLIGKIVYHADVTGSEGRGESEELADMGLEMDLDGVDGGGGGGYNGDISRLRRSVGFRIPVGVGEDYAKHTSSGHDHKKASGGDENENKRLWTVLEVSDSRVSTARQMLERKIEEYIDYQIGIDDDMSS